MHGDRRKGPQLPTTALNQIEDSDGTSPLNGRRKARYQGATTRIDDRQAERGKKSFQRSYDGQSRVVRTRRADFDELPVHSNKRHERGESKLSQRPQKINQTAFRSNKTTARASLDSEAQAQYKRPTNKIARDKLAEDDAEIAFWERKLGIKGRQKLPKSFEDDGLAFLLEPSEDDEISDRGTKRKRSDYDTFLAHKRLAVSPSSAQNPRDRELQHPEGNSSSDASESSFNENTSSDECQSENDDAFSGFSEGAQEFPEVRKERENPYVAPSVSSGKAEKYVPPKMRTTSGSDIESIARIKRQLQGLLNRLSQANLTTILQDFEQVYQANARAFVSATLIELLVGLLADRTRLNDTFIVLHAGFIAALYKVIGIDFGAHMVETLITSIDESRKAVNSKACANLTSVLSMLYVFQVIGSRIVFDYIKIFLQNLSEDNTELLLVIVKTCGQQLRQDDPSSLKDIVILLQTAAAEADEATLSVRTKFMIETMNNLKNNRLKAGVGASAVLAEHTSSMRKTLGSLNERNNKASEPLRIGLDDVRAADKSGKWWLIGASWRGKAEEGMKVQEPRKPETEHDSHEKDDGTADLAELAREQGMNTEVRRAIFTVIMSATDYQDARLRLLKLHLKKSQELEIPRILNQCMGAEQPSNPYYTLIARKLCADRKMMKAFQFGLWDLFRRMGEGVEDEDSDIDEEVLSTSQIVNYGRMYGSLIAHENLPLASLKKLDFALMKPKTRAFLEVLLTTLFLETRKLSKSTKDNNVLSRVFRRVASEPQVIAGLQLFLSRIHHNDSAIVSNKKDDGIFKQGVQLAQDLLARLQSDKHDASGTVDAGDESSD